MARVTKRINLSNNFSNYVLSDVKSTIICMNMHFPHMKLLCPFYAPVVCDGNCRFCGLTPHSHRKYFSYHKYARIIQKCYFNYMFNKFIIKYKPNHSLFTKNGQLYYQLFMLYKKKYYRNWEETSFKMFIN